MAIKFLPRDIQHGYVDGLSKYFVLCSHNASAKRNGGFFVVPLGRVVVEAVACPGVAVRRVINTVLLKRRLTSGACRIDPFVVPGVIQQHRRLNPGHILRFWRAP